MPKQGSARTTAARKDSVRLISLEAFVAIAERGTIAAAGRALDVDESTVRFYLSELEEWLGKQLLIRRPRLALSPDGKVFLPEAKEVVSVMQKAKFRLPADLASKNHSEVIDALKSIYPDLYKDPPPAKGPSKSAGPD